MDTPNETISESARQAAERIAVNTDAASAVMKGPRFLFNEYIEEQAGVIQRAITAATAAQAQRIAELEKERDAHMQTINGVIMASQWDGCDGLAAFIRQTIADLQSRVTVAEQRAQGRQEQLTGLRRKAAEAEQTCNTYREQLEQVKRERDEAIKSLKKVRGEYSEMRKNRDDLEICAGEYEKNRDALRAELASARRQAQTARSEAAEDAADLDWLARHVVVVRLLLVHGARVMFCATPEDDDGYMGPSDLRSKIRAARHAAGTVEDHEHDDEPVSLNDVDAETTEEGK